MSIIESKILDRQFTKLILKSLKAGYYEFKRYQHNVVRTPQESIISPILSNIFLHQLDKFIQSLITDYNCGTKPRPNPAYRHFTYKVVRAKKIGDLASVKLYTLKGRSLPSVDFYDPNYRAMRYVRYAEDWMIGIRGPYKDAIKTLEAVNAFYSDVNLTINMNKTKITNLNTDRVKFLGVEIFRTSHTKFRTVQNVIARQGRDLRTEVPTRDIAKKLAGASFLKKGKPYPKFL